MKNILARGGIEFLAVFLGIALSFNVEEWREDAQIKNRLKSDYINIKKDLEKDLPYLERIAQEQETAYKNSNLMLQMLNPDSILNYKKYMELNEMASGNNTFFGTQSSYDASVSSGRLNYFENDELSNEIGKIYSHHYYRIHYNGELLDNISTRVAPRLVSGTNKYHPLIQKNNINLIRSHDYLAELQQIYLIQSLYVLRCKWGIDQMKKVIIMLEKAIEE
jgi:hypothetical protein